MIRNAVSSQSADNGVDNHIKRRKLSVCPKTAVAVAFIPLVLSTSLPPDIISLKTPISHYNAGQRGGNGESGEFDDVGNKFKNIANSALIALTRNNVAKI